MVRIVTARPPEESTVPFVVATVTRGAVEEPYMVWCDGKSWHERADHGAAYGPFATYEAAFSVALESAFARARDYASPHV